MSKTPEAPWARASMTWYGSTRKSFRMVGSPPSRAIPRERVERARERGRLGNDRDRARPRACIGVAQRRDGACG